MAALSDEMRRLLADLKAAGPPYKCPRESCSRPYKSFSGIKGHLISCQPLAGARSPAAVASDQLATTAAAASPRAMSWLQAQQNVDVSICGRLVTLKISEDHQVISACKSDDVTEEANPEAKECKVKKSHAKAQSLPSTTRTIAAGVQLNSKHRPEKAPPLSDAYIRLADSVPAGLDSDDSDYVEYDMDDEDSYWLQAVNKRRVANRMPKVSEGIFEYLIDRLEKESYFQAPVGQPEHLVDEDAVCCVCNDGECENTNFILFCDMCNLAVHQECYGVPYIPEGQWLCKRCLLSPSEPVSCCLCPNLGGAMKQTTDDRWAHVACALWIPEVHFSNSAFLEPIDGIHKVPFARRRLVCYVCKQRDVGACIQCNKASCYTAFHVTCALSAGLYLKFEIDHDENDSVIVHKTAFCDMHAPDDTMEETTQESCDLEQIEIKREQSRRKMRKARKILAEKRQSSFSVLLPTIPTHRLNKIISRVKLTGRKEFYDRLRAYWTLKRRSRFGVPLLRRLQITQLNSGLSNFKNPSSFVKQYAMTWNNCRTSLEMGRLILELLRKREKQEMEIALLAKRTDQHKLWPLKTYLFDVLDQLDELDEDDVFAEPVDCTKVRGYRNIIEHPMDLSTMRQRVQSMQYANCGQLEDDFNLMVNNCLKFNQGNQYFYDQGIRMRDKGGPIVRRAVVEADKYDFSPQFDETDEQTTAPVVAVADSLLAQCSAMAKAPTPSTPEQHHPAEPNAVEAEQSDNGGPIFVPRPKKRRRGSNYSAHGAIRKGAMGNGLSKANGVSEVLTEVFKGFRQEVCSPVIGSNSEADGSPAQKDLVDSPALSMTSPTSSDFIQTVSLEPFDLVWARPSLTDPWFPGILVDPNVSPSSFADSLLDIPVPSEKVLSKRSAQQPYLVNLFNSDKTWHWLDRCDLRPLGLDHCLDKLCLRETTKLNSADDVSKAFDRAIKYRCLITGETVSTIVEQA